MCLNIVIEYQVEDTKFAQEKHIFSMYLNSSLILPRQKLETYCLLDTSLINRASRINKNQRRKPITYLFEAQIEIRLNQYYKDIISHLLERFLGRETLHLCGQDFVTKFPSFTKSKNFKVDLKIILVKKLKLQQPPQTCYCEENLQEVLEVNWRFQL